MEITLNRQPVYSPTQSALGAFLGGPLAAIVFIRHNFKALRNAEAEKNTVLWGGAILLGLILLLSVLPAEFPNMVVPLITVLVTRMVVEKYQFTKQAITASESLTFHSNWRVFLVGLASLVAMLVILLVVFVVLEMLGVVSFE